MKLKEANQDRSSEFLLGSQLLIKDAKYPIRSVPPTFDLKIYEMGWLGLYVAGELESTFNSY